VLAPRRPDRPFDVAALILRFWWAIGILWLLFSVWVARSVSPG
jgi:hypothetical protein